MSGATEQQDVVDLLTADHHYVLELIGQIDATMDPLTRRDLADIVIAELVKHSVAEEMFVYPVMKAHLPGGEAAVDRDVQEHKELERTMKLLEGVPADDPGFGELLAQLRSLLVDHARDEEEDQFPQLRSRVPREELITLREKVELAKKASPTRPHPASPNNELFHKLAGPGVGLVDRLRDRLSGRAT